MKKINQFIKTSLLGGIAVILPITILILIFKWIYNIIIQIIHPITKLLIDRSHVQQLVADAIVVGIILFGCFLLGVILKTKIGKFIHDFVDIRMSSLVPGYKMVKSTVMHFFNGKKSPFSSVALVQAFENDTLMTGFITDEHSNGIYTVFVPCGPNPTTGFVFHLKPQYVHPVNVPVEDAFRSVISCGAGSKFLMDAFQKKLNQANDKLY